MTAIEKLKQKLLNDYNVDVRFSDSSVQDLKGENKGKRPAILYEIARRAKNGPLMKPQGIGESLHSPLHSFAKIKPKALNIRIIYRPVQQSDGVIKMEIIAIGPRDKDKAYELAAKRLAEFLREME